MGLEGLGEIGSFADLDEVVFVAECAIRRDVREVGRAMQEGLHGRERDVEAGIEDESVDHAPHVLLNTRTRRRDL